MQRYKKRTLMSLSIAQILLSVALFILGMVDGIKIRYGYVSLLYTPCWTAALALPIGILGLVAVFSRRPSSILIIAIWSVSVACVLYSAMTVYMYHHWGLEMMLLYKHIGADSFGSIDYSYFVKKDTKLEYTKEETSALAVFILVIVFSIIEMILAAAIAKSSDKGYLGSPEQPHPMYYMYYQNILVFILWFWRNVEIQDGEPRRPQFRNDDQGQDGLQTVLTPTGAPGSTMHRDESSANSASSPGGAHVNQSFLANL